MVANQLLTHMNTHQLQEPLQSAYRNGHSTETALVRIQNDLLRAVDRKECAILVLLDLSAAFDTIDHSILLNRLKQRIGMGGVALKWINSYLTNRTQAIFVQGVSSASRELIFGVPQGSVLGPKLFCVYSGPIGVIAQMHNLEVHLYADDTQLYIFFDVKSDPSLYVSKVEACIKDTSAWMRANKLKLNDEKTELLVISSDRMKDKAHVPGLTVGSNVVQPSSAVRNLGAMFDDNMKMIKHVHSLSQKAHFHLRNIRSIRKCLAKRATEQLIHAFVSSTLDNGNALLYGLPASLLVKLQRVPNTAARIVTLTPRIDHITPILKDLHWLPVKYRVQFKIIFLVWRLLNNMGPSYIRDMLSLYTPSRALRSKSEYKLVIPKTRLKSCGDRAFSVAVPTLWNKLPLTIRRAQTIDAFKQALKTFLFSLAYQ